MSELPSEGKQPTPFPPRSLAGKLQLGPHKVHDLLGAHDVPHAVCAEQEELIPRDDGVCCNRRCSHYKLLINTAVLQLLVRGITQGPSDR